MAAQITDGILELDGVALLEAVGEGVAVAVDATGTGLFLELAAERPGQLLRWTLGGVSSLERFTCCHRYEPYWMMPAAGDAIRELPGETQWLLVQRSDGRYLLVVPLVAEDLRFSLESSGPQLVLVGQSDDAFHLGTGGIGAFVALGDCPYALQEQGAIAVAGRLTGSRLRRDKPLPAFIDHFGWCTWDAFYGEVSHDKVREGLDSFRAIGIEPRLLILDDGWQQVAAQPTGEQRLVGLAANEKFGGDLAPTVAMAKQDYAVEQFLVWHAVVGYWGGVDPQALPRYQVREAVKNFGTGIRRHRVDVDQWMGGPVMGLVPAETIGAFYHDYHRGLRAMGVDGVKVDSQGVLESLAQGQGGRVALNRAYREALDGSVQVHFGGTLINCMSCANETWYFAAASNCIRSSGDFWPQKPETHGMHQYTNAQVCMWFSEFIHPDWDMFQSGHAMGGYHAAARALSGGPVYVSDKPGGHDPAVLRKLVLHDGSVLRCDDIGRPTLDCLFHDPTAEAVPLKIFNRVGAAGLVGLFHARYQLRSPLQATVSAGDVPGLIGERFACYRHRAQELCLLERGAVCELELAEAEWELATLVPVEDGLAVIGLADRLVAPATVRAIERQAEGMIAIEVLDAGELVLWCEQRPAVVTVDGIAASAQFDAASGCLKITVEGPGAHRVQVER